MSGAPVETVPDADLAAIMRNLQEVELIDSDGEPMDSSWNRAAMNLLINSILWIYRGREDFYVDGNMFIYYSLDQAKRRDFKGPDFFFVKDRPLRPPRRYWVVWEEGGKVPNVIIELLSERTEKEDRTRKKKVYEQILRTPEYFIYDFDKGQFEGWRLDPSNGYVPIEPGRNGWLWSKELELWLGGWRGEFDRKTLTWPRFFHPDGKLVLTDTEYSQEETARAQAEVARLRALLAQSSATAPAPPPAQNGTVSSGSDSGQG